MSEQQHDIDTHTPPQTNHANVRVAVGCLAFFFSMVGLAYASVPLYQLFCQITGFGGTTQVANTAPVEVLDREITVRFDANVNQGLGWDFAPEQRSVTMKIGELSQVSYTSSNPLSRPSTGSATFNVTPPAAGAYFNKMECFCFTETTLAPGEKMDMPVVFFVDPDIVNSPEMDGITTITLSYTFFRIDDPEEVAQTNQNNTKPEPIGIAPVDG
ncbi:MAG: cytochrome c oxidase assembly protein [Pseudomonadota bacterium]